MKITKLRWAALFAATFAMASCGQEGDTGTDTTESDTQPRERTTGTEEQSTQTQDEAVSDTVKLEISGNDQMEYDKDRLQVREGQIVELTLTHTGEMAENAMGHNWVLLEKGVDRNSFAQDAIEAQSNDYIPEGRTDEMIANTELIGGGESTTITFEAPPKGIYTYLCTFPGHHVKMNGKLIVQ